MKTGIEVLAQKAFQAFKGSDCISVPIGCPAVYRETVATLAEAIALKDRLLIEHAGINVFGHVPRHLRAPRGFNTSKHLCRGDNVVMC